jgi:hypothetical protein
MAKSQAKSTKRQSDISKERTKSVTKMSEKDQVRLKARSEKILKAMLVALNKGAGKVEGF